MLTPAGFDGSTTCRRPAGRRATSSCSRATRGRSGRASRRVARIPTAIPDANGCTTTTGRTASFARPGSPNPARRSVLVPRRHRAASACRATFALLVPGSSPHRPAKRWPAARYQALAAALRARGVTPVVVGSAAEAPLAREHPGAAIDLTGRPASATSPTWRARRASRSATIPVRCTARDRRLPLRGLFSRDSDPALCAPRGPAMRVLRRPELAGACRSDGACRGQPPDRPAGLHRLTARRSQPRSSPGRRAAGRRADAATDVGDPDHRAGPDPGGAGRRHRQCRAADDRARRAHHRRRTRSGW